MQPEFARIEIASQREANTVILQSNRRLVQKRDLASYAQSLFRFGNHLRRVSRTPKKRPHRYAGPFEARDSQAGKARLAPLGLNPGDVQNSGLKRFHCSSLTRPGRDNCSHGFANKCLAQSNKSGKGSKATKKRFRQKWWSHKAMTLQEAKSIARHLGLTLRKVRSGERPDRAGGAHRPGADRQKVDARDSLLRRLRRHLRWRQLSSAARHRRAA